ncbi:PREDICTED: uncharacterized protein LOC105569319 [Vollenhovia emeryi]|uniref:uncharacterized protein LOC105569319 n=1 Tax=Vollenhovia emeryi TaxID=411798 RepID=UPI0005F5092B|nr:PREDICTED: uncharacterized protein LOC105569319 [Vollenhovia emeryi]
MSEIKDDPRQVLVLLNSLGFVGITAIQLKAFMKDLKIYRKVKEREKQQRKEEIKTKIINKQQALLKEAYKHSSSNIISSESSNSLGDESVVKVKIRCIPKEEEKSVEKAKHCKTTMIKSDEKLSKYDKENAIQVDETYFNAKPYPVIKDSRDESKQNLSKCLMRNDASAETCKQNLRIERVHPASAPVLSNRISRSESKSVTTDPSGNVRAQSTLSARSSVNFAHKSFIRPWRLQSEAQRNIASRKCDPVALYQKYQREWKQISLPGEAKHSKVRWAVREKMLGTDPHPVPLSRKATTLVPILKKK